LLAVKWEVAETPDCVATGDSGVLTEQVYTLDHRRKEQINMANTKLKIRLKSYDHSLLDQSAKKIVDSVKKAGAKVNGPIPLPTEREVFTILRSVFVNKDSREQFERRTHKRLIEIVNPNDKVIDALQHIDLPSGIDIAIKQ